MRESAYSRLFDRLSDLIPDLLNVRVGTVFCAPPRIPGDIAVYCHIAAVEDNLCLVEMSDGNRRSNSVMSAPWLRLRVDRQNKLAEVLEMEDDFGYHVIYPRRFMVNPRRAQINMFVINWLQVMINLDVQLKLSSVDAAVVV